MTGSDRNPSDERPVVAERTYDEMTPASTAVVYALAAALETDPIDCSTEHGITLYDYVDPEALDRLVTDDRSDSTVTVDVPVDEYVLRITNTGCVRVLGSAGSAESE
ncbi:HalOD1 output domain-containing protein [Natrinema caseinilyticum]|uniref:HalOD1 output domain-containing protein n=1 Tax=Natrinema caseinilyticum TaxID=2961570 RepID=UPI0020C48B5B|nr:HalOD1 output domain-containing protein [Natrinema caseinilyticum]